MAYTKVVIIGGGFGGLEVAKSLKRANLEILLIDKTNHHLFSTPALRSCNGCSIPWRHCNPFARGAAPPRQYYCSYGRSC